MVLKPINFTLTAYTEPSADAVDYVLAAYSPSYGDGFDFALSSYTEPGPTVVDFVFTGEAPPTGGVLKRWTGAAWENAEMKRYTGATWGAATLKRWAGSEWVTVDATGV